MVHTSELLPRTHPAAHGGVQINYRSSAGVLAEVQIDIGFMHRGAEKLLEYRDYRQGAALSNRHAWTSPTAGEYAYVLAAEQLLGLQVSLRAEALRAIFSEIDRVVSHLTFLQAFPHAHSLPCREGWANLMERVTGARMHHQVIRIGGVSFGLESDDIASITTLAAQTENDLKNFELPTHLERVGVLTTEVASQHGVTGPIARASGVEWDERCRSYGWYRDFAPRVAQSGDIPARLQILIDEIISSLDLINAATTDAMSPGELMVRTPKTIRLPEGEIHLAVEGALGANGVSLFSNGGRTPDRVRLRTASLSNLSALQAVLVGNREEDLPAILASWPFISGDSDR